MADVSCSVAFSKKLSNASDVSSKHIYDDVFSGTPATKLEASTFSFSIDDYGEIFSPSNVSLGSSIPILDLPAVDRSDVVGRTRRSDVDYAGVFAGFGDDNRVGVPAEEMFRESKKKAKRDAPPPRSSMQTKMQISKSQEFPCNSGNSQTSKSPAQTRITLAKSQEFCRSSGNNQTSTSVSSHQPIDSVEHFNVSHQKTSQLSKDGADGMNHIAKLHVVPGHTHLSDEVPPERETGLNEEKLMSVDDADACTDDGKGKKQGKHTRAVSDLGPDKQASNCDAGLQRNFGGFECNTFDASCSKQETNCKSQTFSVSPLSSSPQSFGSNDYFRRSSSQRSKSSTNNQQSNAAADSSSPLLEEELDMSSAAAVSAAAMKRAIEEAEAKIRWAKEFLNRQEGDGSIKLTFKDSFKVKTTSDTSHSYEACGLKQNGNLKVGTTGQDESVNEDKVLKQKDNVSSKVTIENNNCIEASELDPKDGLAGALKVQSHGAAAQVDTAMEKCVGLRSTCAPETYEETLDPKHRPEFVNGADLENKTSSHGVLKSAEKNHKHEGGGEWEAAKHLSQLITGVKNRLVSFISKQADTEKVVILEDRSSTSGSLEQSEGNAYQVQDANTQLKREADQDHLEKKVEMNHCASSGVGEIAQDFNRKAMGIQQPELNEVKTSVPLEQGEFEEVIVSPDVEMPIVEQCDPSEPEKDLERIQMHKSAGVDNELIQEVAQDHQSQEISDDSVGQEYEKARVDANELDKHDVMPEATYQSRGYDSKEETNCKDKNETGKEVQDEETVNKRVNKSFNGEDGNWRQEEGCNWGETEMPMDPENKLEDIEMVEETCKELQARVQAAELCTIGDNETIEDQDVKSKSTIDLTEISDDSSEHDEHLARAGDVSEQDVKSKATEDLTEVADGTSEHDKHFASADVVSEQDVKSKATVDLTEVADDTSEHDKHFASVDVVSEQDVKSKATVDLTEVAIDTSEHDIHLACAHDACKQDVKSKATVDLTEVADDTSEHDKHLFSADNVWEHDESLLLSKNKEACVQDERSEYAQRVESAFEEKERMAESATTPFELKVNVEQPISSQIDTRLVREDICEQTQSSSEVADDVSEPDDYFPAGNDICEQDEQSSLRRNEEASRLDDRNQYSENVHFTFEEQMTELTNSNSETKGNRKQPSSDHTENELIGEDMCEQTGCSVEVADETWDHDECPSQADDVCKKEDCSCLNGNDGSYGHHDRNQYAQDVKFSFEDEKTPESTVATSEPESNVEQTSSVQTVTMLIGEEMIETSISAGNTGEFDIVQEEIEDTHEVLSHTNVQKTECETDLDFEHEHTDKSIFKTDVGPENQDGECELRTDTREFDMASDQDKRMHDLETSYKRKRWFDNRDEVRVFYRSGILLGDEISLEVDQENAEESKVDDILETHADEMVNESGEATNASQADAASDLEDGHGSEASHRRRRWFENRGEEVLHKPSVFYGARVTTELDDEIAQESELDGSLRNCVDNLVNDRNEGTGVREYDVASDQVESRASAEAAHRRRRWFENGEKLGPAQKSAVLEDSGVNTDQEEEAEIGADTAKHGEIGEMSTSSITADKQQSKLNNREKEKEKERIAVERAIREARQRAFAEARERAAVEVRQKAAAISQDRQGKASSEVKSGSDKASIDAKLKAERAAVERATAEARERALQRAMSEKGAYKSGEKDPKNQTSDPSSSGYSSAPFATEKSSGAVSESPQRRKAISERNRRTMERAAKALEEKNMRDLFVQKEQAERNRFADTLDAEVKRWLTGKEGNLRSLLSTLQYILGPDCGWQPIPLTDLVTSTAVRKAYKRAALCVHPDKLQQRGATIEQKYICEKVFDLLKDAWHKFNSDGR